MHYNCSMIGTRTIQEKTGIPPPASFSHPNPRIKSREQYISRVLTFLFVIIAVHSFTVGFCLVLHPPDILWLMGFSPIGEKFFPVQGGVFHILMCMFYLAVALRIEGYRNMIYLCFFLKSAASLFLVFYYLFVKSIIVVLLSGIVDGIMATAIITVYYYYRKQELKARYNE